MAVQTVIPAHPKPGLDAPILPEPSKQDLDTLATVQNYFEKLEGLPSSSEANAALTPLSEKEKFFLTRECFLRFIRATKHTDAAAAIKRLEATLVWRRDWDIDNKFTPEYISPEQETGKQLLYGFDNQGRPLWIMRPSRQNTKENPKQLHHMIYFLTLAEYMMPLGVEKCTLLINFADRSTSPSWNTSRTALSLLQDHYPERLGRACVINLPWLIKQFFKLISPFIDPVTREKLSFDDTLSNQAPREQLEKAFGGDLDFSEYDHQAYWFDSENSINAIALGRRDKMFTRWQELGGKIGISENDIKANF